MMASELEFWVPLAPPVMIASDRLQMDDPKKSANGGLQAESDLD
jgi:hypothetical protein